MLQSKLLSQFKVIRHCFSQKNPGLSKSAIFINQVHSNKVVSVDKVMLSLSDVDADGMVTKEKRFIGVKTADCLPILIFDPKNNIVGAIHAGWKGLAGGILKNTVKTLRKLDSFPENIFVAIGPYIKSCCYNIPIERIKKFERRGIEKNFPTEFRNSSWYLDLGKFAQLELTTLGIPLSQIEVSSSCTSCDQRFSSFRRDGENCGRMVSIIGLVK